jgi:DNA-binding transcriptional LysR family regulator
LLAQRLTPKKGKPAELRDDSVNSRQIEAFAAVMKSGTASRAAEFPGVSQPAVSRLIAELEQSIGFALFDRVRSRLTTTPETGLFYVEVEASFRGMDALRKAAAHLRDRGSCQIRVATLSALDATLVPRAIARFHVQHPTVRVTLHVLLSRDVRDLVASGQCDASLGPDGFRPLRGISARLPTVNTIAA